jgi:hypothetical protein
MRRAISIYLTVFLLAGLAVSGSGRAQAESGEKIPTLRPIMTTYDVYVGGIHFLTANILFEEQGGKYQTHVHAHTYGYLYKWLKWDGDILSTGRIKGDHFVPASYRNLDSWRDKLKKTEMDFDPKGNVRTSFEPPRTDNKDDGVTPDQKRGALDPVTALLQMLGHVAVDKDCTVSVPVFDGRRRFDLNGEDGGTEYVDETDYGVYTGMAHRCDVDFSMIAGEWKERDQKHRFWEHADGQAARDPFHIWLAPPSQGLPELPIRLESTSAWGNIMVHLSEWHYATPEEIKG